jgi:hypothetical protein
MSNREINSSDELNLVDLEAVSGGFGFADLGGLVGVPNPGIKVEVKPVGGTCTVVIK